jgi:hypothetical protein
LWLKELELIIDPKAPKVNGHYKGLPSGFSDSEFPKSFKIYNNDRCSKNTIGKNTPFMTEVLKKPLKGYNKDKLHDTDPGKKVPEPILKSIKGYQTKSGCYVNRKGYLKITPASKGAGRPHLYQENGHHYISRHPGHKQIWREYSKSALESDSEEEDGDEVKEEEEEDSEGEEDPADNESEGKEESEGEAPRKTIKPSSNHEGESQHPVRPKAPPKKLRRFGQDNTNEGEQGHELAKHSRGNGSGLPSRPKHPPKKVKRLGQDDENESEH